MEFNDELLSLPKSLEADEPTAAQDSSNDTTAPQQPQPRKEEVDTCRICRGEGSAEEPLFYPCKCSGSIKFVHQDCLMEWLSHSQKKYCELCKTPFHFTKLYSPNMPNRLPTSVFLRKAILHVLSHLWTWLRGLLVGCVWLISVPWIMRFAWRIMFWVGDAGWARDSHYILPLLSEPPEKVITAAVANPSAAASLLNSTHPLPGLLNTTSQTLNLSQDPFMFKIAKGLWTTMAAPLRRSDPLVPKGNSTVNPLIARMIEQSQSSILSEVHFLKTLTPSPFANRFIMDVLEGQIITLSVVIVCILVFLIREWVVQQQPVIDLGAAEADNALAQAGGGAQNQGEAQNEGGEEADNDQVHGAVADAGAAVQAESSTAESFEQMDQVEQSLRDLGVLLDLLEHARSTLDAFESHLDSGIEGLPSSKREENQEMKDKCGVLEQRTVENLRKQHMSLNDLADVLTLSDTANSLLKEMFEKLEHPESTPDGASQARPSMPERGASSIAADIARDMKEGVHQQDEDSAFNADEDGEDSNGSWQQILNLERVIRKDNTEAATTKRDKDGNVVDTPVHDDVQDDVSWVSTTESTGDQAANDTPFENPFAPNTGEQEQAAEIEQAQESTPVAKPEETTPEESGWLGRLIDWFWGDIQPSGAPALPDAADEFVGADDEQVMGDLADEAPFVPFEDAQPMHGAHQFAEPVQDEVDAEAALPDIDLAVLQLDIDGVDIAAAAAAGAERGPAGDNLDALDAEAIEDAEDLEGILELIGMQGPLAGLIQNAVFSSILISLSIALCVFVPYVWGKLVLLHIAEPSLFYKVPLKTATVVADLAIDTSLMVAGFLFYGVFQLYRLSMKVISVNITNRKSYQFVLDVHKHAKGALDRLIGGVASTNETKAGDFLYLSLACHAALYAVEEWAADEFSFLFESFKLIFRRVLSPDIGTLGQDLKNLGTVSADILWSAILSVFSIIDAFYTTGSISLPAGTPLLIPDDPMLTYWNARDRALAILAGYAAVGFICVLYVKIAPVSGSVRGKRIESYIVEACLQAGGVLKVILIISIEMIAFPLFCGFLLDFALMPLFENATFSSRVAFTLTSPWTSGFVHWFVGTCYMFHFALFVSMCRRILRTGVLYFIRDPDDPTFHPVRDVLERNVVTQLRKIAFSAIVYGALIIVCLGGIVWGLWAASGNVLPIHWSSTGSNIEFPLDILFYNFLTPFVVLYAKPSAGVTTMYGWWFRKAARALRLSDFLFRDQKFDEEGHWVRHTWKAWFTRRMNNDLTEEDVDRTAIAEGKADQEALDDGIVRFVPDGRYVRAPSSDQVRIPKGSPVFVPVSADNKRLDGMPDDEGVHALSSTMVAKVYIPPWFKVRVGLFIVAVWLFAAATGICVTILPLLFGRYLLTSTLGPKEFINDIYAFSLGVYLLGGALYAGIHRQAILNWTRNNLIPADNGRRALAIVWNGVQCVASLLYVYSTLTIGLPLINAVLLEVYILMPIHYFFDASEHHVMHLVQDWTLGILYVRIGMRIFLFDPESRPARAISQVFVNGYFHPDARRATRFFVLPALLGFAMLMGAPFLSAVAINKTYMRNMENEDKIAVMRLAYPIASGAVIFMLATRKLAQAAGKWRARIRDEVYLVGERLHNFGERKVSKGKEKASPRPSDIVAL
jgi:E3 ubiquitin-protein ligase MARCH6